MSILYAKHRPPFGGVLTTIIIIMHKNTIEKIKNRYEKRNKIIDFMKYGQEKRDELDPIKDKDQIRHINMKLDMASATLINELDSMLDEVESQL